MKKLSKKNRNWIKKKNKIFKRTKSWKLWSRLIVNEISPQQRKKYLADSVKTKMRHFNGNNGDILYDDSKGHMYWLFDFNLFYSSSEVAVPVHEFRCEKFPRARIVDNIRHCDIVDVLKYQDHHFRSPNALWISTTITRWNRRICLFRSSENSNSDLHSFKKLWKNNLFTACSFCQVIRKLCCQQRGA